MPTLCRRAFYDKRLAQEVSGDALGEVCAGDAYQLIYMLTLRVQLSIGAESYVFVCVGVQWIYLQDHGRTGQARFPHEAGCAGPRTCPVVDEAW